MTPKALQYYQGALHWALPGAGAGQAARKNTALLTLSMPGAEQ
jgi:hypothetical protein